MRNIPLPSRDSARNDLVTTIKRYKYKQAMHGHAITEHEIEEIIAIYDRYDADQGAASEVLKGGDFPLALIDALKTAYDKTQENRQLYPLRQRLFEGVTLCPICGIDPAVELDHFLPRSEFKPLAIYARNLVPICHTCNHTKLAGFGEQNEEDRRFLHAYFDALPDVKFLEANINIREGGLIVTFQVVADAVLPEGYAERLTRQMSSLRLNDRYVSEVNTYISSHAITLHLLHGTGGQSSVRDFLNLQSRYEAQKFYLNHWRPTLLAALAQHDDFTDGGFALVLPLPDDVLSDVAIL